MPAPARGHLFPMVPLTWALRDAGHQVVVIGAADAVSGASEAGLLVVNAMDEVASSELNDQFFHQAPELFRVEPDRDPLEVLAERKPLVVRAWDAMANSHISAAEKVRPDFIVYDPIFGVGAAAAAKLKVPAVAHAVSLADYSPELLRGLEMFARHGLAGPQEVPTILPGPTSLMERVRPSSVPVQFVPYSGDQEVPIWVFEPAARPRILVTFGTLGRAGDSRYLDPILEVARQRRDLEFVMTMVEGNSALPESLPENFRACGWLPLNAVLPSCQGVIHHGGLTSLTCAAQGIPQMVVAHGGPDMMAEAELLRRRGAAIVVNGELSAAHVEGLLTDEALRQTGHELCEENASQPRPSTVVAELLART